MKDSDLEKEAASVAQCVLTEKQEAVRVLEHILVLLTPQQVPVFLEMVMENIHTQHDKEKAE